MTVAMRYRDVGRALLAHGCTWKQGKGDHEKWYCPCGKHMAVGDDGTHCFAGSRGRCDHKAVMSTEGLASVIASSRRFIVTVKRKGINGKWGIEWLTRST
jgi:hypothetical protein